MNNLHYAILPFFSGTFILVLGYIIYKSGPKLYRNKAMFLMCIGLTTWLYSYTVNYLFPEIPSLNLILGRFSYCGVTFIPLMYYHFIIKFLNIKNTKLTIFINTTSLFFIAIALFTNLIVKDMVKYFWGPYPVAGLLHPVYLVFVIGVFIYCLSNLFSAAYGMRRKDFSSEEILRIKYVFWSYLIGNMGSVDFIQNYGFEFYPFGALNISIFVAIMTYAIIKHQLLDIEVIIRRAVVFAGIFGSVYFVFAIFAYLAQNVFSGIIGDNLWIRLIPSVLLVTIFLDPLKQLLVRMTDRFLFQKKYDYRQLLNTFSNEVLTVLDLDKLVQITVDSLSKIIRLESCALFLHDKEEDVYILSASRNFNASLEKIAIQHPLIDYFISSHTYLCDNKSVDSLHNSTAIKAILQQMHSQLILPVFLQGKLTAFIALGRKKSGEDFSQDDLDILVPLSQTLAVAISNARLFTENTKLVKDLAQLDKMRAIATLAAGMAHEIKNPLTGIKVFAEYLPSKYNNQEFRERFHRIVSSEVKRIDNIVKNILSFSKPRDLELKELQIEKPLEEILELLSNEFIRHKIILKTNYRHQGRAILGDHNLLKQVFLNLVLNATDVMSKGGTLTIDTQIENSKLQIKITDTGSGMTQEDLKHVFDPFFTKKDQGTGLGLSVAHGIVEKHKGDIFVSSTEGVGTTFTLEFPVA